MKKTERVELASPWGPPAHLNAGTCPVLFGDRSRDHDEVVAVQVNGARFDRLPREPFFAGSEPSLVLRVAMLHPSAEPWTLIHP